ncbi:hypothetical protein [Nitrosomonas sp.]|uniref:hypothetical protein n=1 Tax=Nitrosomonas sp. TaxID=42353 RepID=UPI0025ED56A2|nr:hypothetical protein [Nitrosomonas sp.]
MFLLQRGILMFFKRFNINKIFMSFIVAFYFYGPYANAQTNGSWIAETESKHFLYAATVNDSGALLGQYCFPGEGSCIWLVGMEIPCNKDDKYHGLANSDIGAQPLELLCDTQLDNGLYRYVFTDFKAVDTIVRRDRRLGIAIPLADGQFRVVRFDLEGATRALDTMRSAADRRMKPAGKNTRDQLL